MRWMTCVRWVLAAMAAVAVGSCATTGGEIAPRGDEGAAKQLVSQWSAALKSQDTDAIMAFYSDQFTNAVYPSKAAVRDAVEQARVIGYLEGMQTDTSTASVSDANGQMTVGPITLTGGFGQHVVNLLLREENGALRIVSAEDLTAHVPAAL